MAVEPSALPLRQLATEVISAIEDIRDVIGRPNETQLLLFKMYAVQDSIHRLQAYLDDEPQAARHLDVAPRLISRVVNLLRNVERLPTGRLPGIRKSCAAINNDLIAIEQIRQQGLARSASD